LEDFIDFLRENAFWIMFIGLGLLCLWGQLSKGE